MLNPENEIVAAKRNQRRGGSIPPQPSPPHQSSTPPAGPPQPTAPGPTPPYGPLFGPATLPPVPRPVKEQRYQNTFEELAALLQTAGYKVVPSRGAYLNEQRTVFLPGFSSGMRLFNPSDGKVVDLTTYLAKIWTFPHQTPGRAREIGHADLIRSLKQS